MIVDEWSDKQTIYSRVSVLLCKSHLVESSLGVENITFIINFMHCA